MLQWSLTPAVNSHGSTATDHKILLLLHLRHSTRPGPPRTLRFLVPRPPAPTELGIFQFRHLVIPIISVMPLYLTLMPLLQKELSPPILFTSAIPGFPMLSSVVWIQFSAPTMKKTPRTPD